MTSKVYWADLRADFREKSGGKYAWQNAAKRGKRDGIYTIFCNFMVVKWE